MGPQRASRKSQEPPVVPFAHTRKGRGCAKSLHVYRVALRVEGAGDSHRSPQFPPFLGGGGGLPHHGQVLRQASPERGLSFRSAFQQPLHGARANKTENINRTKQNNSSPPSGTRKSRIRGRRFHNPIALFPPTPPITASYQPPRLHSCVSFYLKPTYAQ